MNTLSTAIVFVSVIVLLMAFSLHVSYVDVKEPPFKLEKDGVQVYRGAVPPSSVAAWKDLISRKQYREAKTAIHQSSALLEIVRSISREHVFQDYVWIIEKSAVHTCHRDNNGTFFNEGQKHDSYTMLVYLEEMERCLGVIPKSHVSADAYNWNMTNRVTDIVCKAGDVILFNANLIHVGTITDKDDHLRVQLKVSHKDDLGVLGYYQHFNKVLNKENTHPRIVREVQRHVSCMVPYFSNVTQGENIRTARGTDEGVDVGWRQKMFSYMFYGNKDFYDLPNAF